jgi:hypothetical protein
MSNKTRYDGWTNRALAYAGDSRRTIEIARKRTASRTNGAIKQKAQADREVENQPS